jgi:hypothetical protein
MIRQRTPQCPDGSSVGFAQIRFASLDFNIFIRPFFRLIFQRILCIFAVFIERVYSDGFRQDLSGRVSGPRGHREMMYCELFHHLHNRHCVSSHRLYYCCA